MAQVGIVMGSDSDMPVMAKAADILEELGISYEMTIISAHRECRHSGGKNSGGVRCGAAAASEGLFSDIKGERPEEGCAFKRSRLSELLSRTEHYKKTGKYTEADLWIIRPLASISKPDTNQWN